MKVSKNMMLRAPIKAQSQKVEKKEEQAVPKGDGYTPSEAQEKLPSKPHFAKEASAPKPAEMTDNPTPEKMSSWKTAVLIGLTGAIGLTACTPGGDTGTSIDTSTEAYKQLSSSLEQIQKAANEKGDQSTGQIAGQVLNSIAEYSRATGEKGKELMAGLSGTIREHPVLAASLAFAAGSAVGISIDHFGVDTAAMETAGDVVEWVKANPVKAGLIGAAVAGAGYLIYDNLIAPMAEVPEAPTGEHAEAMEATFKDLEKQLSEHKGDPGQKAAEVSLTLSQKIKEYAQQTGRSASEVRNDVMAWAYDHPIVATSLVAGAGVATGYLLSEAGVTSEVAALAGVAIDYAGKGVDSVVEYAKENPVVAGVVVAAVAAGAGYVIYTQVAPAAPAGGGAG